MFIAMNRFKVLKDATAEFEAVWLNRESYLHELDGFVEFHMLCGPERDDHVLYSSHTVWSSKPPSRRGRAPSSSGAPTPARRRTGP